MESDNFKLDKCNLLWAKAALVARCVVHLRLDTFIFISQRKALDVKQ